MLLGLYLCKSTNDMCKERMISKHPGEGNIISLIFGIFFIWDSRVTIMTITTFGLQLFITTSYSASDSDVKTKLIMSE